MVADQGELSEPRVPHRLYALKDGDTFVVSDAYGDMLGYGDGLFRDDTRVLSLFRLTIAGASPSLLSAAISRDNVVFTSHMTNRPLPPLGGRSMPEGVIHLSRARFLWQERMYERITCVNYGDRDALVPLVLRLGADFRDMFEVRGEVRATRGRLLPVETLGASSLYRYEGLDGVLRTTSISFSPAPTRLTRTRAEFLLKLPADGKARVYIEVGTAPGSGVGKERFRQAAARARRGMRTRLRRSARLRTSGRLFNEWIDKSHADLALLTSELPTGPYPYAGIPWFSTAFGRDAIITSLQMLWLDPTLACGVLTFLSHHQAHETSSFQDSAPGKIMHETRKGEMTTMRELPFGRYYGGVDTTPLFLMLAGAYAERTGDLTLIEELWPSLVEAMSWIERVSDAHPDGFLAYARGEDTGLANQGWKDSEDSIHHADGRLPDGPIALVEVQGYVFAALQAMATLAELRGDPAASAGWRSRADRLRAAVEQRFWMDECGFYAIAIDGRGALCRVRGSNTGHLLYTGLVSPERANRVLRQLLSPAFDTGWGIRTLAPGEARFNPMSYHNGSVWPHDTALCAAGMARYGERGGPVRLTSEMFEAAVHFDMHLPELFCGFPRAPGEPPIAYPVACLPQAWAAGSVFMLLQAQLGIRVDGWRGEIHVDHPRLPQGIDRLVVHDLAVGSQRVNLTFQRIGRRVVAFPDEGAPGNIPVLLHT